MALLSLFLRLVEEFGGKIVVKFKYGKFIIRINRKRTLKEIIKSLIDSFFSNRGEIDTRATGIPKHEMEALARLILPDIIAFFESEAGKVEFEKWQQEQTKIIQDKSA